MTAPNVTNSDYLLPCESIHITTWYTLSTGQMRKHNQSETIDYQVTIDSDDPGDFRELRLVYVDKTGLTCGIYLEFLFGVVERRLEPGHSALVMVVAQLAKCGPFP